MVAKVKTSRAAAAVLSVGAVLFGQSTEEGHVTVLDPVPSWVRIRVNEHPSPDAVGFEKVNVQFASKVAEWTLPPVRSMVSVVLVLPWATSVSP